MDTHIPIFMIASGDIIDLASPTMISVLSNTERFIDFKILESSVMRVSEEQKKKLAGFGAVNPGHSIEYFTIDADRFRPFRLSTNTGVPIDTYFRYLIPDLTPNLHKILYLDTDVIVNADIGLLYDEDLEGKLLGAVCNDDHAGVPDYVRKIIAKCGLADPAAYFNAGVLLWDLEKSRQAGIVEQLFETTAARTHELDFADQDVFNIVFEGKFKRLPKVYNSYPQHLVSATPFIEPAIIHFITHKPWKEAQFAGEYYWQYAVRSPFFKEIVAKSIHLKMRHEQQCRAAMENALRNEFNKKLTGLKNELFQSIKESQRR